MMHAQTYEASPTAAMLREAYKAREARKRAARAPTTRRPTTEAVPVARSVAKAASPSWKMGKLYFRAHVKAYEEFMAKPIALFIAKRAGELGFSYDDMVPRGRASRKVIAHRDIIAAEYKSANPDTPWTELARAFGRDHSSIFYGVHKVWAAGGNEDSRLLVERRRARMRMYHEESKAKGEI